jgi:hypothetical protein
MNRGCLSPLMWTADKGRHRRVSVPVPSFARQKVETTVMRWMRTLSAAGIAATLIIAAPLNAQQPPAQPGTTKQDQVAALKGALQQGLARIKQYEWIETTIISLKGEEKARKQNRCSYSADGTVQKVPVGDAAAAEPAGDGGGGRGRRGGRMKEKIVENKKEEMGEYMQRAVKLVQGYVPPDPAKIQAAKDAGHVTVTPQTGGQVRLAIAQYLQPGDSLTIDLDPAASRLLGLSVKSYLESQDDPVTLDVKMATLPDGALYAAQSALDASAKKIRVVIENSGHRPAAAK